jgi:hypothetical protein
MTEYHHVLIINNGKTGYVLKHVFENDRLYYEILCNDSTCGVYAEHEIIFLGIDKLEKLPGQWHDLPNLRVCNGTPNEDCPIEDRKFCKVCTKPGCAWTDL